MSKVILGEMTLNEAIQKLTSGYKYANKISIYEECDIPQIYKLNGITDYVINADNFSGTILSLNTKVYLYREGFFRDDIEVGDILITRSGDKIKAVGRSERKFDKGSIVLKMLTREPCVENFEPDIYSWNIGLDYGVNKEYNIAQVIRDGKVIYNEETDR